MDLDEWEYLSGSDDGNRNGKRLISRDTSSLYENSMIDMDYFQKFMDPPKMVKIDPIGCSPNPLIPAPVDFDCPIPESTTRDLAVKELISAENYPVPESDHDSVSSQGFTDETREDQFADMKLDSPKPPHTQIETAPQPVFQKVMEDEFADMKLDSPKSADAQIEPGRPQPQFEEGFEGGGGERATVLEGDSKSESDDKGGFGCKENPEEEELESDRNGGGLNIWKMGMTGVGALCSFGFAFATVCVIALGSRHRHRERHHQDQNLHFQIYTHEKRFQMVLHQAAKLNGVVSVVRGDPLSRAHISIGAYFEGL